MSSSSRPPLSGEQISRLLRLLREVDSVELKLTVPESDHRSTIAALDIDPLEAQIRQVVFFDTPDLALYQHGLVARARRTQGRADDSVVKLRPVDPNEMPSDLRSSKRFVVEVDAMPGGYVCSGALKADLGSSDVREAQAGRCRPRKLFTKQQRALFAEHAPDGCSLDDVAVLGPITVFKLKFAPTGLGRRLAAELWNYPDGSRILELSTKTAPQEAFQAAAELKGFMADRGIDLSGEQQTKTRTALEYFSQVLTAGG
ncbi:MAG: adenylate cyclase [Acidimicrobiales bacterium]